MVVLVSCDHDPTLLRLSIDWYSFKCMPSSLWMCVWRYVTCRALSKHLCHSYAYRSLSCHECLDERQWEKKRKRWNRMRALFTEKPQAVFNKENMSVCSKRTYVPERTERARDWPPPLLWGPCTCRGWLAAQVFHLGCWIGLWRAAQGQERGWTVQFLSLPDCGCAYGILCTNKWVNDKCECPWQRKWNIKLKNVTHIS